LTKTPLRERAALVRILSIIIIKLNFFKFHFDFLIILYIKLSQNIKSKYYISNNFYLNIIYQYQYHSWFQTI
jgi:hypothetical protein